MLRSPNSSAHWGTHIFEHDHTYLATVFLLERRFTELARKLISNFNPQFAHTGKNLLLGTVSIADYYRAFYKQRYSINLFLVDTRSTHAANQTSN